MEKVIQYDGATVTVRRGNVRSRLRSGKLYSKLGIAEDMDEDEFLEMNYFVRYLTQTTIEGKCDLAFPSSSAPEQDLKAAMDEFLLSGKPVYDEIVDALGEVDADDFNEEALRAETDPKD